MYPFFRLAKELYLNRHRPSITLEETHVIDLRVRPWDIDPFLELNNGRVLTLMDLGRFGLLSRFGAPEVLKSNGWYGTVAGSAVRYRRRITVFQKLELRTRVLGWDDRFTYVEQAFWRADVCCAHAVLRLAITSGTGIVPSDQVAEAFGFPADSPALPDWVSSWAAAETARPWPPEF